MRACIACLLAVAALTGAGCGLEPGSIGAEYAVRPGNADRPPGVVLNVREVSLGPLHSRTDRTSLKESPDGKHLAYIVYTPFMVLKPREYVMLDGVAGKTYGSILRRPVFSPDSRRLAYIAEHFRGMTWEKNTYCVVVNGVEGREYKSIRFGPVFSPDSKRLAYVASRQRDRCFAVVDGVEGKPYAWVVLWFSPDSRHVVSYFHEELRQARKLAIDAVEVDRLVRGRPDIPIYSPDGKHMALLAARGQGACVSVDGVDGPVYDEVRDPHFSADSRHMAYTARRGGKWMVVLDGVERRPYDRIDWVNLSPTGGRLAYLADRLGVLRLVIEGRELPGYDGYGAVAFSPDGRHFAFSAGRGKRDLVVRDGADGKLYDYVRMTSLTFSPDSGRLAYTIRQGKQCRVVVDGVEGAAYDRILDAYFSPDGRHVAYKAQRGKRHVLVVDGVETREVDEFFEPIRVAFDGPDRINCTARRGRKCFRMEVEIKREARPELRPGPTDLSAPG